MHSSPQLFVLLAFSAAHPGSCSHGPGEALEDSHWWGPLWTNLERSWWRLFGFFLGIFILKSKHHPSNMIFYSSRASRASAIKKISSANLRYATIPSQIKLTMTSGMLRN